MASTTIDVLRRLGAGLALVVGLSPAIGPAAPAGATQTSDDGWITLEELDLPPVTDERRAEAVIRYEVLDRSVIRYSVSDRSVRPLETVEQDGEETVIDLASDILFATDEATLPETAGPKIAELLTAVPEGAALAVHGHTDSVASDEYNLDLSRRRAEAVAAAVRAARPDLVLDVKGFGESQLKVPEAGDDLAEDRAANRRVELRYRT